MHKLVVGAVAVALLASGCSTPPPSDEMIGPNWQIVSLNTQPSSPDVLPASAAGAAHIVFGQATISGNTGCGPLQGAVSFTKDGKDTPAREATEMTMKKIEFREPGECEGGPKFVHDSMERFFVVDASYAIKRLNDTEIILTKTSDAVDQPSMRLMAQ
ncbi:hypothetical protein QP027_09510 [Corynebacterium breve]|uniref:META domain-containing protein n=1 Tax=Corynebacterium breve TaxID=3049799 RepID=A0ABY8VCD5_9CORY|nr:hypothetical protein [Corynebacterium breve]WIM67331.1 hypothetical protein QP027_09510 [Corynebacterium breve]